MSERRTDDERLIDDELARLLVEAEKGKALIEAEKGKAIGRLLGDVVLGRFSYIVDALRELQVLSRTAYFVTTDEHGNTVSIERIPDTDAEALRAENARLRAALTEIMDADYPCEHWADIATDALEGGTDG